MHDWRWLCGYMGILDSAEDLAAIVSFLGVLSLIGAIGVSVYFLVRDIRGEFLGLRPTEELAP
jgi:hypothetical protein